MNELISLAHGDGGEWSHQLIKEVFVEYFGNSKEAVFDAASINIDFIKLAITTDTFVVKPLFFSGGSIGKLAVAGTVNDLIVSQAIPLYLTCGFVIEEGFPISELKRIVKEMKQEADKAGVKIVAGDTKVVERGSCDGVFINTTGIGKQLGENPTNESFEIGDQVIITGTIGDHGVSILSARDQMNFTVNVDSDCASLNHMLLDVWNQVSDVRIMRDPTRGGLATTLVEIAEDFNLTILLSDTEVPIKEQVHGVCDLLGFDPMYVANEGKSIIIVKKDKATEVLSILKQHKEGIDAAIIGEITGKEKGRLLVETPLGSKRMLSRLSGTMLPRIC